jgi:succinate dehydrogenase flavin-adding protein (antitoxin of CptAB toxin-antitoxin module)
MRELDALLTRFLDQCYLAAEPEQRRAFEALLSHPDPEILGLLTGRAQSDDPVLGAVVAMILAKPFH